MQCPRCNTLMRLIEGDGQNGTMRGIEYRKCLSCGYSIPKKSKSKDKDKGIKESS